MNETWDSLTTNQRYDYIVQALYLIDHGYVDPRVSVDSLAQRLFISVLKRKIRDGV